MMANPPTSVFLARVANRLVSYSESEDSDFVRRLRSEAARARTLHTHMSANTRTYYLVDTCGDLHDDDTGPRICTYSLVSHGTNEMLTSELQLTQQQADDLSRQLDAPVDYIND